VALSLRDHWIWDSWFVADGDLWHGFFLQAPKSLGAPERRHWHVSVGHATSRDLRDWTYHGVCFRPSEGPAWDDLTTWTGSVVRSDDGLWHLFYTGTSRDEGGLVQRIGHAVSADLHDWRRTGDGPCLDLAGPAARPYETSHRPGIWHDRACRDPWVMRDPDGDGWLMLFTARVDGVAEANAAGAIGLATSTDLRDWALAPPVFAGAFGQLEVPQLLRRGGRWYCLFCVEAGHTSAAAAAAQPGGALSGTHYLIGDDPRGPWRVAPFPFLDGARPCRRYAGRICEEGDRLRLLGFVDRPGGAFVGILDDPEDVIVAADGTLARAGR
jgi:beta-fructofuranosidase